MKGIIPQGSAKVHEGLFFILIGHDKVINMPKERITMQVACDNINTIIDIYFIAEMRYN